MSYNLIDLQVGTKKYPRTVSALEFMVGTNGSSRTVKISKEGKLIDGKPVVSLAWISTYAGKGYCVHRNNNEFTFAVSKQKPLTYVFN